MSELEKQIPPAGEEIHLPEGSLQPLLLTVGITALLLGLLPRGRSGDSGGPGLDGGGARARLLPR